MISALLSIAALAATTVILARWRVQARQRSHQTWDSLVAQLQPDWSMRELRDPSVLKEKLSTSLSEKWQLLEGARGLWVMHENARVMMEMADYAARNSESVDRKLIETLRSDAMRIRQFVMIALVQYAFTELNENICMNAYRAASIYIELASRLTELVQQSTGAMLPEFVAAM
jgi:hypothetical protein